MPRSVQVVYENGVLRPLEPVNLSENERLTVTIAEEAASSPDQVHFSLSPERWQAFNEAMDAAPKDIPALRQLLTEASLFDANGNAAP